MGNNSCKRSDTSPSIITLPRGIDYGGALKKVSEGLTKLGVPSVNLIVGVCYTTPEDGGTNLHLFNKGECPNNYEKVILLVGETIKDLNQDATIQCFGFGDASTHTGRIFSFYPEERPCPGFEEAASRYNLLAKVARLTNRVSYGPIILKAICIANAMPDKHHVLVIIGSEPGLYCTRNLRTQQGTQSVYDQTINAIATARNYRLSIVLVGVGETNENMMTGLRNTITVADNFKFVDYAQIMSPATTDETILLRQKNAFRLAVFENLLTEVTERLHVLSPAPEEKVVSLPPLIPPG